MRIIIERIEDGIATVELENGKMINLPSQLFEGFRDGDVLKIELDREETELRKSRISQKLSEIFDE